jgi:hypothetical protein
MADPTDVQTGKAKYKITEGMELVDDTPVVNIDTAGAEKIELHNKGPNTVWFRTDETTPTALATGNGDQLTIGQRLIIEDGKIDNVKLITSAGETANVAWRLYS